MKVKIFVGEGPSPLEEKINEWLEKHPDALLWKATQSESMGVSDGWTITVTIWYKGG